MTALAIARSSFITSLLRYSRSWGLWLLLLVAPVGARFMISNDEGQGIQIAVGQHLPVMTSAVLGVSLGVVVSTLLLPIGYIFLRSNTTRNQPWQVEEVTAASRIAISLGRFAADVAVFFAMLTALTLAGWFLGWLIVTGPYNIWHITLGLWIVAAPALMGLAAIRQVFVALPFARRGFGDFLYFVMWMASIIVPTAATGRPSSFAVNMYDFTGFLRPLIAGAPMNDDTEISIGGDNNIKPGRVPLDVMVGIAAPGYVQSRLAWAGIAVVLAALAGLFYRPHTARQRKQRLAWVGRWLQPGAPPVANMAAPSARPVALPFVRLIVAEFRLIGAGRLFLMLAGAAAIAGLFGDFRHIGSPAALLLLIFGLTAHAGRSEARGLLILTQTALMPPMARRIAFVIAGVAWAMLLALPAVVAEQSLTPLGLGLATGAVAALIATALASISHSGFAPRMVLLILWYGYLST